MNRALLLLACAACAAAQHGQWTVNVKDFGAKGDGVTDDSAAFVTALTQGRQDIRSLNQQRVVLVPPGTYLVSQTLRLYFYTSLIGTDTVNRPVIKMAANFAPNGRRFLVEGPLSCEDCPHVNDFYYHVKNLVLDLTAPQNKQAVGIHWAVSQATMLRNIHIKVGDADMGIYGENGSGGVMSDVEITGGRVGMYFGSQQWTFVNLQISDTREIAVQLLWNWEMVFLNAKISNTSVGFQVRPTAEALLLKGCTLSGIREAVFWTDYPTDLVRTYVLIDTKVEDSPHVFACYLTPSSVCSYTPVPPPASGKFDSYVKGYYVSGNGAQLVDGEHSAASRQTVTPRRVPAQASPVNVLAHGVKGDCSSSDSAALQDVINKHDAVLLPSGCYLLTSGLTLRATSALYGEGLSELRSNITRGTLLTLPADAHAAPTLHDLIITTAGDCPGCTMLSWGSGAGAAWDVHFRVYHNIGTILHVLPMGGGYIENMWGWVGDHDINTGGLVTVKSPRGALIETNTAGVTLAMVGTAFEHSADYQYAVSSAQHVALVMPQTESPYWQVPPTALGLSVNNSADFTLYAGGFYNWFTGVQGHVIQVDKSVAGMYLPSVNTQHSEKSQGVRDILVVNGKVVAESVPPFSTSGFCSDLGLFESSRSQQ